MVMMEVYLLILLKIFDEVTVQLKYFDHSAIGQLIVVHFKSIEQL